MIPLYDERMIGKMGNRKFNKTVFCDISNELEAYLNVPGTVVRNLQIVGYGAPKGNYKSNEKNCSDRSLRLKNFLMKTGSWVATVSPLLGFRKTGTASIPWWARAR